MRTTTDGLARALGWTSLALGAAQLAAPRAICRLSGVDDSPLAVPLTRLTGGRELLHAAPLLGGRAPARWAWTRVAGDALDLALLGRALTNRTGERRRRVARAMTAVAGITALDALCAIGDRRSRRGPLTIHARNARDAIVRVTSTAICGSDLHLVDGYVPGMKKGDIIGHEFMGEVVEVGPEVRELRVGDRVVVPFTISCGRCFACEQGLYSVCENSNPNAGLAEKLMGHSPAGAFGYSHMLGGFAGGQAEYVRVPFADVGPIKVDGDLSDEQLLFLSDILPTGYMGAELCDIKPGQTVAVWGAGPVGLFAALSARLLGAGRVICIDRFPYRLRKAEEAGAETLNYEEVDVLDALRDMTDGLGPDACIDAVGLEAHHPTPAIYAYDRAKQATRLETERPYALREAIMACRNGGVVSVIGVYGGLVDKFPMGSIMNRSLTLRAGQCHVQRYMEPLLRRIRAGEIDPTFVISHRLPLSEARHGFTIFKNKQDKCTKVVLTP